MGGIGDAFLPQEDFTDLLRREEVAFDENLPQGNVSSRFPKSGLFRKAYFQLIRGDKALFYRHFPQDRYATGFIGLRIIHVLTFREIIRDALCGSHYSRLDQPVPGSGKNILKGFGGGGRY